MKMMFDIRYLHLCKLKVKVKSRSGQIWSYIEFSFKIMPVLKSHIFMDPKEKCKKIVPKKVTSHALSSFLTTTQNKKANAL